MTKTPTKSTQESGVNTNLENTPGQSGMMLWSIEEGVYNSMSYVNDSIKHVHGLMKGLQISSKNVPKDSGQVLEIIEAHNTNAGNVQVAINCAKEIRNLMKLKLEAAEVFIKLKSVQ